MKKETLNKANELTRKIFELNRTLDSFYEEDEQGLLHSKIGLSEPCIKYLQALITEQRDKLQKEIDNLTD